MNWYKKAEENPTKKPSQDWEQLYTGTQLQKMFQIWGVKEPAPNKGQKIVISFPPSDKNQYSMATVVRDYNKSTYGKPMWKVVMTNETGYKNLI